MIRRTILGVIIALLSLTTFSQSASAQPGDRRLSRQEYIDKYKEQAIKEMLRAGIPASITLAQGILESADGNSPLAKYANNHFGIKCHRGWSGETFYMDDDAKDECFRKYYSVYESYRDHSEFLTGRSRYEGLFRLKITDYKGWAKGLKKAGYATNPKYANILIHLIETYELHQYDKVNKLKKLDAEPVAHRENKIEIPDRTVLLQNNIKYTVVKKDDSFYKIAKDLNMGLWQLYKYNDMERGSKLETGQVLYLQPKRGKGTEDLHTVEKGDSMWAISQRYGIRLKKLYKRNAMIPGTEPSHGQKIYLRKNKKS